MSEGHERVDPITAEQLVRGRAGAHGRLARLLAAAASPARPGELTGEDAAVRAFRNASLDPTPQSRRRSMLSTAWAKLATAKAAAVVIAVSGGGVALAAGTGHLPGVGSPQGHPGAHPGTTVAASHHATPTAASNHSSAAGSHRAGSGTPSGSPSPDLRGLCTAFRAGAGDNPGKALDNPAFTVLINAAGGKDEVAAYCNTLLGAPHGKPSSQPSSPGRSGSHTSRPHPSGPPTGHGHFSPTPPPSH